MYTNQNIYKTMKISELKKELDKIYNTYGDVDVCIKNGDDGGEYFGYRDIEYVDIETSKSIVIG